MTRDYDFVPKGSQEERCPRCDHGDRGDRRLNGLPATSGVALLDWGPETTDDVLICLDCGTQFYRNGDLLHPHGVESGDVGGLLGVD